MARVVPAVPAVPATHRTNSPCRSSSSVRYAEVLEERLRQQMPLAANRQRAKVTLPRSDSAERNAESSTDFDAREAAIHAVCMTIGRELRRAVRTHRASCRVRRSQPDSGRRSPARKSVELDQPTAQCFDVRHRSDLVPDTIVLRTSSFQRTARHGLEPLLHPSQAWRLSLGRGESGTRNSFLSTFTRQACDGSC